MLHTPTLPTLPYPTLPYPPLPYLTPPPPSLPLHLPFFALAFPSIPSVLVFYSSIFPSFFLTRPAQFPFPHSLILSLSPPVGLNPHSLNSPTCACLLRLTKHPDPLSPSPLAHQSSFFTRLHSLPFAEGLRKPLTFLAPQTPFA